MARVRLHGLPERWIELAEFEPLDAIAQLLEDVARTRADSLLTIDATRARLDELAGESPVAVQQVLAALGLPALHGVLKGLLREQVSIRDLNGLIETLVLRAGEDRSVPVLVEHARRAQAHAISVRVASDAGTIAALELGAGWDEVLAAFSSWDTGLTADWTAGRSLADACRQALAATPGGPARPVLLVPRRYRPLVAEMLRAHGLEVPVLAPDEVSSRFTLRLAGSVPRPSEQPVH
jgi:flagellar biosynthesis protein FlhA